MGITKNLFAGKKNRPTVSGSIKLLLSLFWVVTIVLPLIRMLSYLKNVDVVGLVSSERFVSALRNSVTVSVTATLAATALAGILAWCTARTAIKGKNLFSVLFTLPMLIPSISHGMGFIVLLGNNGVLKRLPGVDFSIYGFGGIVAGSVMYAFPVAYLMLWDVLKLEDGTPYEAARVLGLSKVRTFFAVTFPYLRKSLISVLFATFTMIVTDYGVPLMIGGKFITLPVLMYQDVIGMLDFGKGSVVGLILLIPAFLACVADVLNRDVGNQSFARGKIAVKASKKRDTAAYLLCGAVSVFVLAPIVVFACVAFLKKYPVDSTVTLEHVRQAMNMGAGEYLLHSLVISLFVTAVGSALAIVCAYFTSRMVSGFSRLLHLLSIVSLAIPGIVLGLSYILFFKGTFLYGTFAMLILVNTMHFFSSPYLMMYNTFNKLNPNLESVGKTLGVGRWRIVADVLLPLSRETVLEMASYFFVNSMMTISAVSFLATASNKPVALMITQFEGQMQLESAAFVSILILSVNIAAKVVLFTIKRRLSGSGAAGIEKSKKRRSGDERGINENTV